MYPIVKRVVQRRRAVATQERTVDTAHEKERSPGTGRCKRHRTLAASAGAPPGEEGGGGRRGAGGRGAPRPTASHRSGSDRRERTGRGRDRTRPEGREVGKLGPHTTRTGASRNTGRRRKSGRAIRDTLAAPCSVALSRGFVPRPTPSGGTFSGLRGTAPTGLQNPRNINRTSTLSLTVPSARSQGA